MGPFLPRPVRKRVDADVRPVQERQIGDAPLGEAPAGRRAPVEEGDRGHRTAPRSSTRSTARSSDPPVETTSSTNTTRSPGLSLVPSTQAWRPWPLGSLRTENQPAPDSNDTPWAKASAPMVGPPTASNGRGRPRRSPTGRPAGGRRPGRGRACRRCSRGSSPPTSARRALPAARSRGRAPTRPGSGGPARRRTWAECTDPLSGELSRRAVRAARPSTPPRPAWSPASRRHKGCANPARIPPRSGSAPPR